MPAEKFCPGRTVSVGYWKEDQTGTLPVLREKLPKSSRDAEETPWPAVLDSQMIAPEPLTRQRLPEGRNWRDPAESTVVPWPADQTITPPEYAMAATNVGGLVVGLVGAKPREKVLFGDDQARAGSDAWRADPGRISDEATVMAQRKMRAWSCICFVCSVSMSM